MYYITQVCLDYSVIFLTLSPLALLPRIYYPLVLERKCRMAAKSWPRTVLLRLVVDGVLRVSQVEDDRAVRTGTTAAFSEDVLKVDRPVEGEGAIVVDVNPVNLVVTRGVEDGDL